MRRYRDGVPAVCAQASFCRRSAGAKSKRDLIGSTKFLIGAKPYTSATRAQGTGILLPHHELGTMSGAFGRTVPRSPVILIPQPKQIDASGAVFSIRPSLALICQGIPVDSPEVQDLSRALLQHHRVVAIPMSRSGRPETDAPALVLEVAPRPSIERQGYELILSPDSLRITGVDSMGLSYGIQTLCQVLSQCRAPRQLPTLKISDWPDFPIRAAHLTLFRYENQRPSLPFWEALIERVATTGKLNALIVQVDWMLSYRSRPELAQRTALLSQELSWLCTLGRRRQIAVIPHLQCLSHQYFLVAKGHPDWLVKPDSETYRPDAPGLYETLHDAMGELQQAFGKLPAHSPLGSVSPPLHLGFDEVGRLPTPPGGTEPEVFLRHLRALHRAARSVGFANVGIWTDMLPRYDRAQQGRALLHQLPTGTILFPWDYNDRDDFAALLEPLTGQGFVVWATGSAKYHRNNLGKLARHARKLGCTALVGSCWNSWAPTLVDTVARPLSGLLLAGEYGWSADSQLPLDAPVRALAYEPMQRLRELTAGLSPIDSL